MASLVAFSIIGMITLVLGVLTLREDVLKRSDKQT